MTDIILNQYGLSEKNGIAVLSSSKTKGYVYILETDGCTKIGKSVNPEKRIETIRTTSGRHIKRVAFSEPCNNYSKIENEMHKLFKDKRIVGEWFDIKFDDAVKALKSFELDIKDIAESQNSNFIFDEFNNKYFASEINKFLNERPNFKKYLEDNGFRLYVTKHGEIIVTNDSDVDMDLRLFIAIYKSEVML